MFKMCLVPGKFRSNVEHLHHFVGIFSSKFVSSAAAVEPKKKFVILLFVFVSFPVVLFDLFFALAGIILVGFLTSFDT